MAEADTVRTESDLLTRLKVGTKPETPAQAMRDLCKTVFAGAPQTPNNQTGTTYTFVLTDANKDVELTNASAITATVPPNSSVLFPIGSFIDVYAGGAGRITIAAGAGVTINSPYGSLVMRNAVGAHVRLTKMDTDTWSIRGDVERAKFYANILTTASNVTGNGTAATVVFDEERYDYGGCFDGTSTFTATVPGVWRLATLVRADGLTAAADQMALSFVVANRDNVTLIYQDDNNMPVDKAYFLQAELELAESDTVTVTATVTGEASDVVDIIGAGSVDVSYFSAHLLA